MECNVLKVVEKMIILLQVEEINVFLHQYISFYFVKILHQNPAIILITIIYLKNYHHVSQQMNHFHHGNCRINIRLNKKRQWDPD